MNKAVNRNNGDASATRIAATTKSEACLNAWLSRELAHLSPQERKLVLAAGPILTKLALRE